MKYTLTTVLLILSLNTYSQDRITTEDLKSIIGSWEGSITYLDYQTNKPYTMPANLIVRQGKNNSSLVLNNIYPNEPKANDSEKIKVTKNGLLLNKKKIISREELENGSIQIQAERSGKDDNRNALIRYTYIIGSDLFVIRKEVQFDESGKWTKRSEFNYSRNK